MQANLQQLISAARLLKEAQDLVGDVETIMGGAGYDDMARRLKDIAERLRDELHELRQLMGRKP
jgi:tetrahydromethanopterin S-methyltransferase subunit G